MRVLPGGESNAGGGTDRGVDVEVGELDSLGGKPVDVLGIDGAAEAGKIGVAHVINEDDDDVGALGGQQEGAEEKGEEDSHE